MKRDITVIIDIIQPPRRPPFWTLVVWKSHRSISRRLISRRSIGRGIPPASLYPTLHKEDEPTPIQQVDREVEP